MGYGITLQKQQRYQTLAKIFLSLLLVYLLFHLFVSERSIPSLIQLSSQEEQLTTQLASLESQKHDLFDRVTRLRPETLDPDLVEDYSIQMLGRGVGDEMIIVN